MSSITRSTSRTTARELLGFAVRSSGRDLSKVRRPERATQARKSGLVPLKKAEMVALAESQGVDASGTKTELVERLTPESNDTAVATDG